MKLKIHKNIKKVLIIDDAEYALQVTRLTPSNVTYFSKNVVGYDDWMEFRRETDWRVLKHKHSNIFVW